MEQNPSWGATGLHLVKKFPAFHGTRRFITTFTSAHHLSLSRVSSIQSMHPHPISWSPILISFSHLHLGPPSCLFPSGFPTKTLCMPLLSSIRTICTTHLILLGLSTRRVKGEQNISLVSSLCSCSLRCYLVPLTPKHSQQHPIPRPSEPTFLPHS
jgi:hypothetical protein